MDVGPSDDAVLHVQGVAGAKRNPVRVRRLVEVDGQAAQLHDVNRSRDADRGAAEVGSGAGYIGLGLR